MSGKWLGFGATARGPGHVAAGLPNQDAWRFATGRWGCAAVVCDGMGSYRFAREGALAGCAAAIAAARLWARANGADHAAFFQMLHNIWLFMIQPLQPEECHCTCLLAIKRREDFFLAQLGDGMICVCDQDRNYVPFGLPEKDFSNATYGLGRVLRLDEWQWTTIPAESVCGIALATDGVADDLYEDAAADWVAEYIDMAVEDGRKATVENLKKFFQEWPVAGHTDDKTVACIYRRDEHGG